MKKKRIKIRSYLKRNGTQVKSHYRTLTQVKKEKKPRLKKRIIPRLVMEGLKRQSEEDFEWATALDFEDTSKNPYKLERIIEELGNGEYVWMIEGEDYEVHIHTHSNNPIAYPSDADLYALEYGQPHIIISDFKHHQLYNTPRHDTCIYSIYDLEKFEEKVEEDKKWATNIHNKATETTIEFIKQKYPSSVIVPEYDKKEKIMVPKLFNFPLESEAGIQLRKDYYSTLRNRIIAKLDEMGVELKVFEFPYELKTKTDYNRE
jgi:hypothetical protein